ncbi:MAG: hypothetical protein GX297_04115 [Treponema sp.]|nr:hypothetical protein [Treponema sp.]
MKKNFHKVSVLLKEMESTQIDPKKLMFFIYENYEFFFLTSFDEDERYDFILSLLPTLKKIVERFDKTKASLENYLRFIISRNRKTWKQKKFSNQIKDKLIEREYTIALSFDLTEEIESSFCAENISVNFELPARLIKILPILAYKASAYISREQILKIASISNTNAEEMFKIIKMLNKNLETRMSNVEKLTKRRNSAYLKRYCYSYEINLKDKNSIYYENASKQNEKIQNRYKNSQKSNLSTQIVTPSYLIAEALGVSSYSIDNKLRYVHKMFPDFFKPRNSNN